MCECMCCEISPPIVDMNNVYQLSLRFPKQTKCDFTKFTQGVNEFIVFSYLSQVRSYWQEWECPTAAAWKVRISASKDDGFSMAT